MIHLPRSTTEWEALARYRKSFGMTSSLQACHKYWLQRPVSVWPLPRMNLLISPVLILPGSAYNLADSFDLGLCWQQYPSLIDQTTPSNVVTEQIISRPATSSRLHLSNYQERNFFELFPSSQSLLSNDVELPAPSGSYPETSTYTSSRALPAHC